MISFLCGVVVDIDASMVVVDVNGVGYKVNISLRTFSKIKDLEKIRVYTHLNIKDDAHTLYGFYNKRERKTFIDLISISGVGPSTAIIILSSLSADELKLAIVDSDVNKIKSIKGIGLKTAERIILELKDKTSINDLDSENFSQNIGNTIKEEALSALTSLGISKNVVERHIDSIIFENNDIDLESLIKEVLKRS